MQSLRNFVTQRVPLMLCGYEDVLPIAERLHGVMLGNAWLYVFRKGDLAAAIDAAREGTLCLPNASSEIIDAVIDLVRDKGTSAPRILYCKKKKVDAESSVIPAKAGRHSVISIPTLSTRRDEVPRIIDEVIADILHREGVRSPRIRSHERQRLRDTPWKYVTELEDTICRLVMIRNRGVYQAGKILKLSHSTLSEWMKRWSRDAAGASIQNLERG